MSPLDLDAIEVRYAIAACEVGDSDSWRSAEDVPALVARLRVVEADLAAMTASRDGWLEIALKRIDERDEVTASALLTEPSRDEMERALGDLDETFACGWTIRRCIDCRTPVAGGPTRCLSCAGRALP